MLDVMGQRKEREITGKWTVIEIHGGVWKEGSYF